MKKLYYMTQYASYMSDAGYYESMADQLKVLDGDALEYLVNTLAPKVNDLYNKYLFDLLYLIDNDGLDVIIEAWEHLADGKISEFLELFDFDIYDLINPDDMPRSYDDLMDWADEDLKAHGVDARCLYWLDDLEKQSSYNYFVFNAYMNGFTAYDSIDDALVDVLVDAWDDIFEIITDKLKA